MKKEDLMIGDWVNIQTEKDDEPMYSQVEQLWECEIDADFETDYENVYPIELTYDILESNFGKSVNKLNIDPNYLIYPKNKCMIGVQLRPSPDCRKSIQVYNYETNRGIKYECTQPDDIETPFYVHELQHILKQCGIKEEIIL